MYLQLIACLCRLEIIMKNKGNQVRLHAHTKERPDSGYTHPPCIHRKNCKVTCLCDKMCGIHCKLCRKPSFRCTDICPAYETAECEKLNKPPYVCNGCGKKTHCLMPRKFYSSKYAHDEYRSVLVDCRVGINQTPESIQSMNDLLVPSVIFMLLMQKNWVAPEEHFTPTSMIVYSMSAMVT